MIGVGEGSPTTTDFKMVPEVSEQRNFTPLPDFRKPVIKTEPSRAVPDMSDMPPELSKMMEEIKMGTGKGKGQAEILPQIKKEKPQGFWMQLKESIKNFFRNLFK